MHIDDKSTEKVRQCVLRRLTSNLDHISTSRLTFRVVASAAAAAAASSTLHESQSQKWLAVALSSAVINLKTHFHCFPDAPWRALRDLTMNFLITHLSSLAAERARRRCFIELKIAARRVFVVELALLALERTFPTSYSRDKHTICAREM